MILVRCLLFMYSMIIMSLHAYLTNQSMLSLCYDHFQIVQSPEKQYLGPLGLVGFSYFYESCHFCTDSQPAQTPTPEPEIPLRLPTPPTPPPDLCLAGTAPMEPKDLLKAKKPRRKRRKKAEIEAEMAAAEIARGSHDELLGNHVVILFS